jgi:O-antigen ligase
MSVLLLIGVNALWRSENRKTLLVSAIAVCFVLSLLILSLDYTVIKNELSGLPHTFFRRIDLSIAASAMLENNWLTGIGGGSFYSQFSPYRTLEVGNAYYNYAHNDILQLWIEYGLIGLTILLMFVGAVIRDNIRVLSQTTSGIRATFAYASIYSTIAVGVHSLVDFPLHMPGFSVCYLVIISTNSLLPISPLQPRKVDIRR